MVLDCNTTDQIAAGIRISSSIDEGHYHPLLDSHVAEYYVPNDRRPQEGNTVK
jgi:hypothetical protein